MRIGRAEVRVASRLKSGAIELASQWAELAIACVEWARRVLAEVVVGSEEIGGVLPRNGRVSALGVLAGVVGGRPKAFSDDHVSLVHLTRGKP